MTQADDTLIKNLSDQQQRRDAERALRERGAEAAPALLAALEEEPVPEVRRSILRLLLQIKEPRAETAFREAVHSPDEELRAIGAAGLYALNAPDAIQASLLAIDDAPDLLHIDFTPAVTTLSKIGLPALPGLMPLLDASNLRTRQRAQHVLESVTQAELARQTGQPANSMGLRREWQELWVRNGSYRYDAHPEERQNAIRLWKSWLEDRQAGQSK